LDKISLGLSASKWGREHLIACRVIQHLGGKILPKVKAYAPEPKDLKHQAEWLNIQLLIDGPSKDDLRNESRRELERENPYLRTVWSVLAKCLASREPDEPKEYPKRKGQQTQIETPPCMHAISFTAFQPFLPQPSVVTTTALVACIILSSRHNASRSIFPNP